MRDLIQSLLLVAATAMPLPAADEETLRRDVEAILQQDFPDARMEPGRADGFTFARDTREFLLYDADKIGRWGEPRPEVGPDRGGFVVSFHITRYPWLGAGSVPRFETEDYHVFTDSIAIKETKDKQGFLWAQILDPPSHGHAKLRDQLMALFKAFDG